MSKLVVLNLGKGNLQGGFPFVTAQLQAKDNPQPMQFTGSLPPNPELVDRYHRWQLLYELLYQARSINIRSLKPLSIQEVFSIDETDITHVSDTDFEDISQELQKHIDNWLDSEEFSPIYRQLQKQIELNQPVRFIIQTEDNQLRKLPWHTWRFFRDYRLAEVSLSPLNFEPKTIARNQAKQVRILAILGDSTGIDVKADEHLLKNLPNAEIVFLVEPDRQKVTEYLWDKQGWDILFFAGHSLTQESGDSGQIYVNQNESLTIAQLKNALTEAIERGLQLAIFNSCDGLGLARQLTDLYIPLTIVMREPVPDRVAQVFLKYFLSEFADGQSFDVAVRKARERLQGIEGEFPGASWLPVIFQNPAQTPPTWNELCQVSQLLLIEKQQEISLTPVKINSHKISWRNMALASLACTLAVMGGRAIGIYQDWELQTYDRLLQMRSLVQPQEGRDERLSIVDITLADTEALGGEYPIEDRTLLQLLQKLERYQPLGVGIDMIRDRSVGEGWQELVQYFKQNPNIIPPCAHPSGTNPGIVSPTGTSEEQSGFINVVEDPDGIIRRHLLATDPPNQSPCPSYYALSTRLANLYLEAKGYKLNFPTTETWEFKHNSSNPFSFQILSAFTGFYQKPPLTRGHQILLNYRAYDNSFNEIARRVTLTEVLQNKVNPSLIRDRIILIGITDPNLAKDEIRTPYNREIRGLVLHAQMVSQILAAVEDGRPLLRFFPFWGDTLWILTCALVAFVILRRFPSAIGLAFVGAAILVVYGVGFFILLQSSLIIPFVPSLLVLLIPAIGMAIYIIWQSDRKE